MKTLLKFKSNKETIKLLNLPIILEKTELDFEVFPKFQIFKKKGIKDHLFINILEGVNMSYGAVITHSEKYPFILLVQICSLVMKIYL